MGRLTRADRRASRRLGLPAQIVIGGFLVVLAACLALFFRYPPTPRYDVAITDVTVYDGTGAPPFVGGVGIVRDRIAAVWHGHRFRVRAVTMVDGRHLALAPGFIDTHSHADFSIEDSSSPIHADNFVAQGVTTIVVGNCGRSRPDIARFRDIVESRGTNVNIATLAGLNAVRQAVMGDRLVPPTAVQLAAMVALLKHDMRAGAIGVSTGLEYLPGRFTTAEETLALLKVAASFGGVHATHMRNEGRHVIDSVNEVLHLSQAARIPLLISHLKITGRSNCSMYPTLEQTLRSYSRRVAPVFVDAYPYAASSTDLNLYLPDLFLAQPFVARRAILRGDRRALKAAIASRLREDGFTDLAFARIASYAANPAWRGLTIRDIDLSMQGSTALDSQLDVMLDIVDHGGAQMIYHNICPDVVELIEKRLSPMVGSDSAIRWDGGDTLPHPRGWGTFPKFLAFSVQGRNVPSLADGIRRMTDLPARFFGLTGRGRIGRGYYADFVLFDPVTVRSRASYRHPLMRPVGIEYVGVNGRIVVRPGPDSLRIQEVFPGEFVPRDDRLRRMKDGLVACTLPPPAFQEILAH